QPAQALGAPDAARAAQVDEDREREHRERAGAERLAERHRQHDRHRRRLEHRPHHEREGEQRERAGAEQEPPHRLASSWYGFENGCAAPWQPTLAQLTVPARTSSAELAWSPTAFQLGPSVE